jgi:hypothetical protein
MWVQCALRVRNARPPRKKNAETASRCEARKSLSLSIHNKQQVCSLPLHRHSYTGFNSLWFRFQEFLAHHSRGCLVCWPHLCL